MNISRSGERPILLSNLSYKLISACFANRLNKYGIISMKPPKKILKMQIYRGK